MSIQNFTNEQLTEYKPESAITMHRAQQETSILSAFARKVVLEEVESVELLKQQDIYMCVLVQQGRMALTYCAVLRKTFGPERDEAAGNGEDCIMRSSMMCTAELILFEL
jgi:hypothetical protein